MNHFPRDGSLEYVLSASISSITLTGYPQVNPTKCNVSLRGDRAYMTRVIPNRIPYPNKEYHFEGLFAREKDTSRHTSFENCPTAHAHADLNRAAASSHVQDAIKSRGQITTLDGGRTLHHGWWSECCARGSVQIGMGMQEYSPNWDHQIEYKTTKKRTSKKAERIRWDYHGGIVAEYFGVPAINVNGSITRHSIAV